MKKTSTLLLLFISVLPILVKAQIKDSRITGTVIDGSEKTIESSTITLLRIKDSVVVKMSVADKNGKFVFENVCL